MPIRQIDPPPSEPATLRTAPLWHGVDCSYAQPRVNWPAVAAAGVSFALLKASEGASVIDPTFVSHWNGARAAGLKVAPYHFFKALSSTPEAQAANFLAVYRSVEGWADLPVAVDVEEIGRGQPSADLVRRVLAFVAILRDELGSDPMVYTYSAFSLTHFAGPEAIEFAQLPLWLADYRERPTVPPPWSNAGRTWAIWQNSDKGHVDGIAGPVDLDVMRPEMLRLALSAPNV